MQITDKQFNYLSYGLKTVFILNQNSLLRIMVIVLLGQPCMQIFLFLTWFILDNQFFNLFKVYVFVSVTFIYVTFSESYSLTLWNLV